VAGNPQLAVVWPRAPARVDRARIVLFLAVLLTPQGLLGAEPAVIRMGMDTRSRPWAFVPGLDYSKEDLTKPPRISAAQIKLLQGVDIDVMKALASRMNVVPQVVPCAWASAEESLLARQFDVLLNAWGPNDRTPPSIVASSPYYVWGLLVAVRSDEAAIRSYPDLAGRRVGHFRDRVIDISVRNLKAGQLVGLDDSDVLFDHLASGAVDAVVDDSTYVRWRVARDPRFRVVGERLNRLGYHVGLRREDRDLYEKVQAAIQDLVASGEIDRIHKRWESPD